MRAFQGHGPSAGAVGRPQGYVAVLVAVMALGLIPHATQAMALPPVEGATVRPWIAYKITPDKTGGEVRSIEFARVQLKAAGTVPEIFWITEQPKIIWVAEQHSTLKSAEKSLWADSRTCPALTSMVDDLDADSLAKLTESSSRRAVGPIYEIVSLRPASPEAPTIASFQGRAGGAIAARIQSAAQTLAPCWAPTPPDLH